LVALIPLLLAASVSPALTPTAELLQAVGGVSLLPLLQPGGVGVMCVGALLVASQHALAVRTFDSLVVRPTATVSAQSWRVYSWIALIVLPLYVICGHALVDVKQRWPFVPLLVTSFYCAVAIGFVWGRLFFIRMPHDDHSKDD